MPPESNESGETLLADELVQSTLAGGEKTTDTNDDDKAKTPDKGGDDKLKIEGKTKDDAGEADAGDDEGDADGDGKPRKLSGSQRLKRRLDRALSENADLLRRLDTHDRRNNGGDGDKAGEDDKLKAPKEEDFPNDYLGYERAMTAYQAAKAARDAVREEYEARQTRENENRDRQARQETVNAYEERLDDARDKIADFDETMEGMKGVQVRQAVIDEIMQSEKGPLIAYHLAKNPERLRELNGMTGTQLAREIGRLEGSVRMPASNKQTKADPPLSKLKGGSAGDPDPSKMTQAEYEAWRNGASKA